MEQALETFLRMNQIPHDSKLAFDLMEYVNLVEQSNKDGVQALKSVLEGNHDDVCEWKFEETNGIAWHCNDKCTTYNQVYIKDLKITLEDFECKCPYCGKKIKVVE